MPMISFSFFPFSVKLFFVVVVAVDGGGEVKQDSAGKNNFLKPKTLRNPLKTPQARNPHFALALVAMETGVRLRGRGGGQGAEFLWGLSNAALARATV